MSNRRNGAFLQTVLGGESLDSLMERANEEVERLYSPEIETGFAELEDGTIIEMIEDPKNSLKAVFAVCKEAKVRLVGRYKNKGRTFAPVGRDLLIIEHIRFPRGVANYESVQMLLRKTYALANECLDLDSRSCQLLAYFVLSSWVIDQLPIAPYLSFIGLSPSGKSTALAFLNLLCRRTLLTGDISSAGLYQVCDSFAPTLLIDDAGTANNKQTLFHLLRTGTAPDVVAIRKNGAFKMFCAKAMSWTEPPDDPALNSRCILIPMVETRRTDLKKISSPEIIQGADELQKQFLQFRLLNYKKLKSPEMARAKDLHHRTRDLYEALALLT